jgi:hypothetical protein
MGKKLGDTALALRVDAATYARAAAFAASRMLSIAGVVRAAIARTAEKAAAPVGASLSGTRTHQLRVVLPRQLREVLCRFAAVNEISISELLGRCLVDLLDELAPVVAS